MIVSGGKAINVSELCGKCHMLLSCGEVTSYLVTKLWGSKCVSMRWGSC